MLLPGWRYEEIKQAVADVFDDYGITKTPIDAFGLASKMNIVIVKASTILIKQKGKIDDYSLLKYPPAVLLVRMDNVKRIMYLDDVGSTPVRQRFSVMHEIAHYVLGHDGQNERNETEANYFATYSLCPSSVSLITDLYEKLDSNLLYPENCFGISEGTAKIFSRRTKQRLSYGPKEPMPYEITINSHLEDSIRDYLQVWKGET